MIRIAVLLLSSTIAISQPLTHAHAHNDYEHARPLFEALQNRFISVEADIHLVHGKLLVSHTLPIFKSKTLEELYLAPLDSLVRAHGGNVYPGYRGSFYLMIDVKSDGEATYPVLKEVLGRYPGLFKPESVKPVIIFLSGNRPIQMLLKDKSASVSLDGRPEDLGKGYSAAVMPVVSDTYMKWSKWKGKGHPSGGDMQRIKSLALLVHGEGKKLRLWAIPDNPDAWKALLESGVDLINTDHLSELSEFLSNRN